jgi:hypothetical protein
MTRIAILAEPTEDGAFTFRAVSGERQSVGKTAGEALDGLTSQLSKDESGLLVVVQSQQPDRYFNAEQCERLAFLMNRWREARDQGGALSECEQSELDALVQTELQASADRTAELLRDVRS